MTDFSQERAELAAKNATNPGLQKAAGDFLQSSIEAKYSYNFDWLGRPIIQYPQDVVAIQEIIWKTRPDLIIETGVAHGGSLVLSASILALLELSESSKASAASGLRLPRRTVVGVDIEIRKHNLKAIQEHPLSAWIKLIERSSTDPRTIDEVRELSRSYKNVMVILDSNHTHSHVLDELNAYARLVSPGCYCVVFDTIIEKLGEERLFGRPWGKGNNPMTAVKAFLEGNSDFEVDASVDCRLVISAGSGGYLRRKS